MRWRFPVALLTVALVPCAGSCGAPRAGHAGSCPAGHPLRASRTEASSAPRNPSRAGEPSTRLEPKPAAGPSTRPSAHRSRGSPSTRGCRVIDGWTATRSACPVRRTASICVMTLPTVRRARCAARRGWSAALLHRYASTVRPRARTSVTSSSAAQRDGHAEPRARSAGQGVASSLRCRSVAEAPSAMAARRCAANVRGGSPAPRRRLAIPSPKRWSEPTTAQTSRTVRAAPAVPPTCSARPAKD